MRKPHTYGNRYTPLKRTFWDISMTELPKNVPPIFTRYSTYDYIIHLLYTNSPTYANYQKCSNYEASPSLSLSISLFLSCIRYINDLLFPICVYMQIPSSLKTRRTRIRPERKLLGSRILLRDICIQSSLRDAIYA